MKHTTLILAAASLLISSCAVHYVATDSVNRHLDGKRQVLASNTADCFAGWQTDTLDTPVVFDFRSEKDTMRYAYTIDMFRDSWTIHIDSMPRLLQPEVTVRKSFRWFTTRYRYTARFPQLDSLPVPISDYLTPDEQRLLLSCNELPTAPNAPCSTAITTPCWPSSWQTCPTTASRSVTSVISFPNCPSSATSAATTTACPTPESIGLWTAGISTPASSGARSFPEAAPPSTWSPPTA